MDIAALYARREGDRNALHSRYLNDQMVRMLRTIGYDVGFCRAEGAYLYDRDGERYLDLLSGFGVFGVGRNHPAIRDALKSVLDADLPSLVQLDVSPLSGLLAERLISHVPYLEKAFFTNSGSEAVESPPSSSRVPRPAAPASFIAGMHFMACRTAHCRSTARTVFAPALSRCCRAVSAFLLTT